MIKTLDVILWGRKVGALITTPARYGTQACFYFDPDYAKDGLDFAPLRAPIGGAAAQRRLPVYPEKGKIFGGLPSFIADSLPDHWGHTVFSEWAAANNIRSKDLSPLDRLAYIGRRGIGAFEFVPPTVASLETPFRVEIAELSAFAQKTLVAAGNFRAVLSPDLAIENLFKVGTSAGGRRPKAVINLNLDSGECYSGHVDPLDPSFTPMIIKFDEHTDYPSTLVEYSYYLMAIEAGIKMRPSRILQANGEHHFLTQRFDRDGAEKLHVQTLAAMNPDATTYEDLFRAAEALDIPADEMTMLFRQMTMNVLSGNIDDHNKNFSFLMTRAGEWHITPAYDFTFAVDTSAPFYVNRHSMSIDSRTDKITKENLLAVAQRFNIKGAASIIESAISTVSNYRKHAVEAGVPALWIDRIESEISDRLMAIERKSRPGRTKKQTRN